MEKIKKFIENPKRVREVLGRYGFYKNMEDEKYIKMIWKGRFGSELDLQNPQGFNEKLQWLKLNIHKDIMSKMVDKYEVRNIIAEKIGKDYLVPLIGVYNSVEEIPWDSLPERCVIKCNHGSHCSIIKDENFDRNKAIKKLNKWMKQNWYWLYREWPYKNVQPKIIVEEFVENIKDYKILCFHGEPKIFEIPIFSKNKEGIVREEYEDFYDIEWNNIPIKSKLKSSGTKIDKPIFINEMIYFSKIISKDFVHARIDWTISNNKLYFGEVTFYDGGGFCAFEEYWNLYLGKYINLSNIN